MIKQILTILVLTLVVGCASLVNIKEVKNVDSIITSGELVDVVTSIPLTEEELATVEAALDKYSVIRIKWEQNLMNDGVIEVFTDTNDIKVDYVSLVTHYRAVYSIVEANWDKYSYSNRMYLVNTSQQFEKINTMYSRAEKINNYTDLADIIIKAAVKAANMISRAPI